MSKNYSIPAPIPKPEKPAHSFADPAEPYPLTVNPCGYYSKKIKGRVVYFARWDEGPEEAEQRYLAQRDDLEAGRTPLADADSKGTIRRLLNEYHAAKKQEMERGDITHRTFLDVERICDFLADHWKAKKGHAGANRLVSDLVPSDFRKLYDALAACKRKGKAKSLVVLGNEIVRCKAPFHWGVKNGELAQMPAFGSGFGKPKEKHIEKQKALKVEEHGERTYTREEVLRILDTAGQPLRAMVLLAINAGLGNSDLGQMRMAHLDLASQWLSYPRPKNEKPRRCWLWKETSAALAEWIQQRPEPKNPADVRLVFLTKYGQPWHKEAAAAGDSPLSHEFAKLLRKLEINGSRNFYALRATYRTEAGRCADAEALFFTMGHALPGMAKHYVKSVHDDRLQRVAQTVHDWLWPVAGAKLGA